MGNIVGPYANPGPTSQRFSVRLWVPDRPGMLGAVVGAIAELSGNVIGLEVLERSGEIAVDELMVELPERPEPGTGEVLGRRLRAIDGAGVEEVRPVPDGTEERGLQVISAAVTILETANPTASLAALVGLVGTLFEVEWSSLVDLRTETCVRAAGEPPSVDWLLAFLDGARRAATTSNSGVMAGELPDAGLVLCIGRAVPFRRREQRELEMLARVADRMCRPLRDRIPQTWAAQSRFLAP